jgi:hypothetical protein
MEDNGGQEKAASKGGFCGESFCLLAFAVQALRAMMLAALCDLLRRASL